MINTHAITFDFPEYFDTINRLTRTNETFRVLNRTYNAIDREIVTLENNDIPTSDEDFKLLQVQRAYLKDQLHDLLLRGASLAHH